MGYTEKEDKKNKRTGIAISVAIHALLLILFFFMIAWRMPDPPPKGIEGIEASFELKVMIIGLDNQIITDDTVVMKILNNLQINTPIEKIYSTDIPIIRNKYKLKNLRPPKEIN